MMSTKQSLSEVCKHHPTDCESRISTGVNDAQ